MSQSIHEVYSPNSAIDAAIKQMLPRFSEMSQRRMKKAIRNAGMAAQKQQDENTDAGARHIFREFIPASILNGWGYGFEYEESINGKTPDWLDSKAKLLMDSYTYERIGTSPFLDRVKNSVGTKCDKYHDIITKGSLRFVVPVYLDFLTGVLLEKCNERREAFRATFDNNDTLWAIMFFAEETPGISISGQHYSFLCLTADHAFEQMQNWRFPSICVYA